ncbi:MAG: diacylglycerol/lipid kinase family protein [Verrucomicrobiales bacterium]|nr:diacylglycerol kinase family lipid kinase [Verrucomicrobiota bacterium JB025]
METPHRYPLIFNPRARSQRGGKVLHFLRDYANRFAVYATNHAGEARELAAKFASQGEPVVIAAGGDGTLNEVVSGLAGTNTVLGLLPAGTMNVFAREMGIPFDSLTKAFEIVEKNHQVEVDIFEANGAPFIQMAGVGFDAMVIEETTWELKKALGPLAYLAAGMKVLGEQPPKMTITCDNGRTEHGVALLAGNGALYGGQFKFFPKADNQDGLLDVLVYKEAGHKLILDSIGGLALGRPEFTKSVSYFQTNAMTIEIDRQVPVEVDGELIGRFSQVRFKETSSRLRVIAPSNPTPKLAETLMNMLQWHK